jgi:hypothetical protein
MKKGLIIAIAVFAILILAIGIYLFYPRTEPNNPQPHELQNCSGGSYSTDCLEGYYCYEHLTGGLGPDGALPIEPYGGDSKCHKKCINDSDCPKETPYCLGKEINIEDMQTYEYLCFSEETPKVGYSCELNKNCYEVECPPDESSECAYMPICVNNTCQCDKRVCI